MPQTEKKHASTDRYDDEKRGRMKTPNERKLDFDMEKEFFPITAHIIGCVELSHGIWLGNFL